MEQLHSVLQRAVYIAAMRSISKGMNEIFLGMRKSKGLARQFEAVTVWLTMGHSTNVPKSMDRGGIRL